MPIQHSSARLQGTCRADVRAGLPVWNAVDHEAAADKILRAGILLVVVNEIAAGMKTFAAHSH
jgi:hypothetical protein